MNVNRHESAGGQARLRAFGGAILLLGVAGFILGHTPGIGHSFAERAQFADSFQPTTASQQFSTESARSLRTHALAAVSHLPLTFEPNVGQTDPRVKFLAHGTGYGLFLMADGTVMTLQGSRRDLVELLTMKLIGANRTSKVSGTDALPGRTNYFFGNDPSRWHRNVPQYAGVRYADVYPGINLLFYGNRGRLEYDFRVAPGADPSQAELEFDSAKQLVLADGDLVVKAESGSVRLESPSVYQEINDRRHPVGGRFVLRTANRVGFEIGPYDHTRELIIDPVLTYSTFFGGSADDTAPSIAVDSVGNIYMAGTTDSPPTSFPPTTLQTLIPTTLTMTAPATHVFVAKITPGNTSAAVYETFLGGGGSDSAVGIGVDGAGNAYIAGNTTSGISGTAPFPTTGTNAYQAAPATGSVGTSHVFVSVLDPTGATLKYSSYLSGNGTDTASGMTKDNRGNVYVTGTTTSNDVGSVSDQFPASAPPEAEPFQAFPRAPLQFFVTKVNAAAFGIGSIAYSTYFGGGVPSTGIAVGGGIAVDGTGNIYFNGTTNFVYSGTSPTTDFPILNAYQACLDVPTPNTTTGPVTCAASSATNTDSFLAKLNPNAPAGSQLIWSTYLGGSGIDNGAAIALDSGAANVYVTGSTTSTDFTVPTGTAAFQATNGGGTDAFVGRLSNPASGNMSLTYFSYLGGSGDDAGLAVAVDTASGALLTGSTQSSNLPVTTGPIQGTYGGSQDAFFARLNTSATTGQTTVGNYVTYFGGSGTDRGTSVTLDSNLSTYFAGDTTSSSLQTAAPLQAANAGGFDTFAVKLGTAADLAISGKLSLAAGQQFVNAGNQATFTYTVTNNGPDVATNITVTANLSTSVTGVPVTFNSTSGCTQTSGNVTVACAIAPLQSGSTAPVTISVTPTTAGSFNGGAVTVSSANNNDPVPGNNSVTVSATATDFTVSINPTNESIPAAGDKATYQVTVTPVPVFSANVSLSVAVPNNTLGASFSSSSVSLGNTPATSTLTINTKPRPVPVAESIRGRRLFYGLVLAIPGMAIFGIGTTRSRRRRVIGIMAVAILLGLVLLQPACGGAATTPPIVAGTQAGTYTMTLTANGGISHNVSFTLTVP